MVVAVKPNRRIRMEEMITIMGMIIAKLDLKPFFSITRFNIIPRRTVTVINRMLPNKISVDGLN